MAKLSPSERLLRQQSPWRLWSRIALIGASLVLAFILRLQVIEPVIASDYGIAPTMTPKTLQWFCKIPYCLSQIESGDPVLFVSPSGDRLARIALAKPGERLTATSQGTLSTQNYRVRLKEDSWFVEKATLNLPRQGDTLTFANLTPAEFDLAIRLFKWQDPSIQLRIEPELWINGTKAPIEKASHAVLNGLPVNLSDLGQSSWQELMLIELQVHRNEHGARQVQIQRKVFQDSLEIPHIVVQEDCYWLTCLKARDCVDSRELGFVPKSWIQGAGVSFLKVPTNKSPQKKEISPKP